MIYFARFPSGSIKIGHTTGKINIRMSNLRSYYGVDPVLLKTMEGDIHVIRFYQANASRAK